MPESETSEWVVTINGARSASTMTRSDADELRSSLKSTFPDAFVSVRETSEDTNH